MKAAGNTNAHPVELRDNLIVQMRSVFQRYGVRMRGGGADFSADFDVTIEHLTVDNRGSYLSGVMLEQDSSPAGAVTVTVNDLVTTHDANGEAVVCTATPGIASFVGQVQSTLTANPEEGGGVVTGPCIATGPVTRVSWITASPLAPRG
jgi:hypothetical protein